MNATLRPMNLGEILDRTFEIYRKRFWVFVGLAAMPILAATMTLLVFVVSETLGAQAILPIQSRILFHRLLSRVTPSLLLGFYQCLAWPLFVYASSCQILREKSTIRGAIARCVTRGLGWIALAVVIWSAIYAIPSLINSELLERAASSLHFSQPESGNLHLARLGSILVLVFRALAGLSASVALGLSVPAWLLENIPLNLALRRGWALAKRDPLRISVVWVAVTVLMVGLWFCVGLFFRLFYAVDSAFYSIRIDAFIAVMVLVSALISPIFPVATTLIYYDQRIRREGYDIEKMMEAAGLGEVGAASGGVASIEAEPQEMEA